MFVLNEIKEPKWLSKIVNTELIKYYEHVSGRDDNDHLKRLVVYGKLAGISPRGRSPRRYSDQIKECTKTSFSESARKALNRDKLRNVITEATSLN